MGTEIFEFNNIYYIIPEEKYESRDIYLERVHFIIKYFNETKEPDFDNIITLSKLYVNKKLYGNKYYDKD